MSSGWININSDILTEQSTFSWRVLGIDDNGELVYVYGRDLILSSISGLLTSSTYTWLVLGIDEYWNLVYISTQSISAWGGYWTGNGTDIWNTNTGNVGIGTETTNGRLHVTDNSQTELYLEETNAWSGTSIHLKNTVNARSIWGYSSKFYIGQAGATIDFSITTGGNVGIGTNAPNEKLQIDNGNVQISNLLSKAVIGTNASGKIIAATSGSIYGLISWFDFGGGMADGSTAWVTPYWNGSVWRVNSTNIYNNGGYVGIGTTPWTKLDVAGTIRTNADFLMQNSGNGFLFDIWEHTPSGWHSSMAIFAKDPNGGGTAAEHNWNILLNPYNWSAVYGNVGIHTAHPEATLHVNGSGRFVNNLLIDGRVGIGTTTPTQRLEVDGNIKLTTWWVISAAAAASNQLYLAANGNVGIGTNNPTAKFYVNDDAIINGNITATAYYYSSDKRFKTNITPIKNALDKILALNWYFFTWKKTGKKDIGVIAQEVETIFPELVQTNDQGYKSVEYGNLVAPLIEAIKELNDKVDMQEEKIRRLENREIEG